MTRQPHAGIRKDPPILESISHALTWAEVKPYDAIGKACLAIDATAKKKSSQGKPGRSAFISFVRCNMDLIGAFVGGTDTLNRTYRGVTVDTGKKVINPDFAEILYYLVRCPYAHGTEIPASFTLLPRAARPTVIDSIENGCVSVNLAVIYGLVTAVALDPSNSDLKTISELWVSIPRGDGLSPLTLNLDLFWGQSEILRNHFAAIKDAEKNPFLFGSIDPGLPRAR